MNRAQKEQVVQAVKSDLGSASIVIVLQQSGLTVAESTDLRSSIRRVQGKIRVVKNTLARLAVRGTAFEVMQDMLKGTTVLAYANEPISISKKVVEFCKNEKLSIIGGFFDGSLVDRGAIKELAKIPSLEELRAKIIALIQTPATNLTVLMKEPGACLARVCHAKGLTEINN
ncbi:MAG: 50S ribosomal protein L10 [Alphaproteobacteria bacterium]